MAKKKDWEMHREEIERLYISDGRSLKEVIDYMASRRGFHATKPSYERRLREWGIRKNVVGWGAIAIAYEQRKLLGKETDIIVRQMRLSQDRVKKQVSRQGIPLAKAKCLRYPAQPPSLNMPDGIILRTPSPGPLKQQIYSPGKSSPWLIPEYMGTLTMLSCGDCIGDLRGSERVSWAAKKLRAIMPETYEGQHIMTAGALCDRSKAWPHEILIQLFLLTNNLIVKGSGRGGKKGVIDLLHRLGQDSPQLVERLLSMQTATVGAIKDQIFATVLKSGDLPLLRLILTAGIDLSGVINTGEWPRTALYVAADIKDCRKSLDAVNLLIGAGADTSFRGAFAESPFLPALRHRHMEVVSKLIESGVRACSSSLRHAIETGSDEVVRMILNAGADANSRAGISGDFTPIGVAVNEGQIEIARMLIGSGADINAAQGVRLNSPGRTSISSTKSDGCLGREMCTTAVGVAIARGHLEMARMLLEQPNIELNQYVCPLLIACDQGHDDIVIQLLDLGADIPVADVSGRGLGLGDTTLLTAMIRRQRGGFNMALCEVFISKGARLDHGLLEAARTNNHRLATLLLSRGSPLGASWPDFQQTALGAAIEEGLIDMAQLLVNAGATEGGCPNRIKNAKTVRFLHQAGLLPGILGVNGSQIFSYAMGASSTTLLTQLMRYDGHIDFNQKRARSGISSEPLDKAIDLCDSTMIKYLIERGAKPTDVTLRVTVSHTKAKKILNTFFSSIPPTWGCDDIEPQSVQYDSYDYPPALVTAARLGDKDILRILLDAADWGCQYLGKALTEAILSENLHLVEDLLQAGASLDEPWSKDSSLPVAASALGAAVAIEDVKLAVHLIQAGANVNKPADHSADYTALQKAAEIGHLELVNILLDEGAEVNAAPSPFRGATALQFAAINGHLEVARILLRAGARVGAEGSEEEGRTALEGAAEHGRLEMAHLLLDEGSRLTGIQRDQCLQAVALAKENGHNAVARFIESVHCSQTERDGSCDDDNGPPCLNSRDSVTKLAVGSVDLASKQPYEEAKAPDVLSTSTGTAVEDLQMSPDGQAVSEEIGKGLEFATRSKQLSLVLDGVVDIAESVETDQTYRVLLDPEHHPMGENPEPLGCCTEGTHAQSQDSNMGLVIAGASPMTGMADEGWQPWLEEPDALDFDMDEFIVGDIDFDKLDWDGVFGSSEAQRAANL
ncbi:hypothetical protein DL765_000398 [Monosporascus sp. GIB2]|nr:hypothetical protein DL765_000398 [Monosporascus sp. GIB2]